MGVITFLLFLLGNLQEFLDSTQVFLLRVTGVSTFLYVVCGVYFLGISVVQLIRRGRVGALRVIFIVTGLVISTGILLFTNFLRSWVEQIR